MAWISIFMSWGMWNGTISQFHPSRNGGYVLYFPFDRPYKQKAISCLRGPFWVQLSYQKLRLLSLPITHLDSCQNKSMPFFIPFKVWEQGRLLKFLELILRVEQYFALITRAQRLSFLVWNLQFSLVNNTMFLPFALCNPRPPTFFGFVTLFHPT